VEMSQW